MDKHKELLANIKHSLWEKQDDDTILKYMKEVYPLAQFTQPTIEQAIDKTFFTEILLMYKDGEQTLDSTIKAINSYKSQPSPQMVDGWIRVEDGLPEVHNKCNESHYVLCLELISDTPFTGWYNHDTKEWSYGHHRMKGNPKEVTHWQPLPQPPVK